MAKKSTSKPSRRIFVVPYGEFDSSSGRLTESGKESAKQARRTILDQKLGRSAVILTGNTRRHRKTAALIAKKVTSDVVTVQDGTPDTQLHTVDPSVNIAPLIKNDLWSAPDGQPVIIITSPQAIASARGQNNTNQIAPGAVFEFNFSAYKIERPAGLVPLPSPKS